MKPFQITIHYCAVCNYEPQVFVLLEKLLKYKIDLAQVILIPESKGVFRVTMNGEAIAEKKGDVFPKVEDVMAAIRAVKSSQNQESP